MTVNQSVADPLVGVSESKNPSHPNPHPHPGGPSRMQVTVGFEQPRIMDRQLQGQR
jgi:hypothetical protein